jgi:hypothetical protein
LSGSDGDLTGDGTYSPFLGENSPKEARANSPAHRAAPALAKVVYSSPAKSSHRWSSGLGDVE